MKCFRKKNIMTNNPPDELEDEVGFRGRVEAEAVVELLFRKPPL